MGYLLRYFLLIFIGISSLNATEPEPCVVVIFGATGDLTARKLVPALYNLAQENHIPQNTSIVGFARGEHTKLSFRESMAEALDKFSRTKPSKEFWPKFQNQIFYNRSDFTNDQGYEKLKKLLEQIDKEFGTQGNRIFYLSTPPSYFSTIIQKLAEHKLVYSQDDKAWSRVIIEKPFGNDLKSAIELQDQITKSLDESQVYRMDHYLGKEGVQNIFTLRFESGLFEPMWNNQYIENVQITMSEEIGIGTRARLWEETGALRDFFQNHLMQLLAIVAMEPSATLEAKDIHSEKIAVLNQIRPLNLESSIVRGQYGPGQIKGKEALGYIQEKGVPESSTAATYVAAKLFIDNPRWEGVPFYIRGGKRLPKQTTEIVINFKNNSNVLFIRIQPNTGIFLKTLSKVPALEQTAAQVTFGFKPDSYFQKTSSEAYEKLIYDCMRGIDSHYVHAEEQLATWRLLDPVLKHWETQHSQPIETYEAGSWGPSSANRLLESGHQWQLLEIE